MLHPRRQYSGSTLAGWLLFHRETNSEQAESISNYNTNSSKERPLLNCDQYNIDRDVIIGLSSALVKIKLFGAIENASVACLGRLRRLVSVQLSC